MAQNRKWRFGPVALSSTLTTNILNGNVTSLAGPVGFTLTQPYILVEHLRAVNKTASPVTVSLWIGATGANAAGTEFAWQATVIAANSFLDWYGRIRLDAADFLVGGAGTATAASIEGEGEIGVS
jgi:hypothetical protein